ncbi:MAG: hypothetical protein ACRDF7_00260 [Candidatus Limnocylindrales bacterium]
MTDTQLAEDAARAQIQSFQRLYLDGLIEFVSVVNADDRSCPACRAIGDQGYLPRSLPTLPSAGCAAAGGCRCRYEPGFTVAE